MRARTVWAIAGLVTVAAGCQLRSTPPELVPSQFVRSRSAVGPNPIAQPVDQNGALNYGELHAPLLPDEYSNSNPTTPTTVSPLVRRAIPAPGEGGGGGAPVATTAPTTTTVARSMPSQAGQYEILGTVIANVNGTPIFADKVLASINSALAADARKFPSEQFRAVARNEIVQKVQELQAHLLEIAAANKFVASEDKTQAELMAQMYRRQLITEAGGSLEMAKERARESGRTFDELVQDRYELELVWIYYQKRIVPKIQITADDMRRYYHQHIDAFTQHAQAHFRLIKIDVEKSGGIQLAVEKADKVVRELKAGADFSDLSQRYNDDPVLKKNGGDEGWVNKGDFAHEKVEQAVWSLQPGEFTDHPIDEGKVLYIAKLEARKPGLVKPFDTQEVQRNIRETLRDQQFSVLREQVLDELKRNAVYFENKDALATSVEMAMQRYALWTAAR